MSVLEAQAKSTKLHVTYDGVQHCIALEGTVGKMVATDVPHSCGGKGEEFSPIELVGAGLGSCMLLSMGTLALRDCGCGDFVNGQARFSNWGARLAVQHAKKLFGGGTR